jgi:hypothetical protein
MWKSRDVEYSEPEGGAARDHEHRLSFGLPTLLLSEAARHGILTIRTDMPGFEQVQLPYAVAQ